MKVIVRGRIQTGSYMDREGRKIYTTDVVVEDSEFAESKATSDAGGASSSAGSPGDEFLNLSGNGEGLPFM